MVLISSLFKRIKFKLLKFIVGYYHHYWTLKCQWLSICVEWPSSCTCILIGLLLVWSRRRRTRSWNVLLKWMRTCFLWRRSFARDLYLVPGLISWKLLRTFNSLSELMSLWKMLLCFWLTSSNRYTYLC